MNDQTTTAALAPIIGAAQEHLHIDASAIQQIGALSLAASSAQEVGDTVHLVIPEHHRHIDLTPAIEKSEQRPRRKTGTVRLAELPSFNVFVADQGIPEDTYIYADPDERTLTAVLNDHWKNGGDAGWRDLRAVYRAELSREFAIWMTHDRKPMDQEPFAIFLEDNIADITSPSGETLLTVATTLQTKSEVTFNTSKRLDNGQVQLQFTENIEARAGSAGALEIPRVFSIGVRLFKGGEGYRVNARLKYRIGAGKVKFWYELERPEDAIELAFQDYINLARENGFTVLIGKP